MGGSYSLKNINLFFVQIPKSSTLLTDTCVHFQTNSLAHVPVEKHHNQYIQDILIVILKLFLALEGKRQK